MVPVKVDSISERDIVDFLFVIAEEINGTEKTLEHDLKNHII